MTETRGSGQNHTYKITFSETEVLSQFLEISGFSHHYKRQMKCYFTKHLAGKTFKEPRELAEYIQSFENGASNISKSARVYLNACEKFNKLPSATLVEYRKFLHVQRPRVDVFVPSDEDVKTNLALVSKDKELELIYQVLMYSGIRLIECINFLQTYDETKFRKHNGFVSYSVAYKRGQKSINNIYLPDYVFEKLTRITTSYSCIRKRYFDLGGTFSLKYLRKWNYNFLIYNGIPESVADFIQGRSSASIGANHYLAKSQQAEYWYEKIKQQYSKI